MRSRRRRCYARRSWPAQLKATIVLKGAHTIISSPDGSTFINQTGNPGLAKAGSGDVLTGILASLISQGMPPFEAAVCAVYLHGAAADRCIERMSEYFMAAGRHPHRSRPPAQGAHPLIFQKKRKQKRDILPSALIFSQEAVLCCKSCPVFLCPNV